MRTPYLIEEYFGVNMQYWIAFNVPAQGLLTTAERKLVKDDEVSEIKRLIFSNLHEIDEPIDMFSKHTMLHDAVAFNREELFYFLI